MAPGENLARYPGPFRCCVIGRVNSGKSLIAKHILMAHQAHKPQFKEVYVVHGMSNTEEYDDIEPTEIMTEIPSYEDFEKDVKKMLLIDDYDYTRISGEEKKRLSELFRFGSSHMNMSVILMHQCWFRVPKVAKDCCNVFIIFRPVDKDELHTIARRVGLKKEQIEYIFDTFMPHFRDSLTVNLTPQISAQPIPVVTHQLRQRRLSSKKSCISVDTQAPQGLLCCFFALLLHRGDPSIELTGGRLLLLAPCPCGRRLLFSNPFVVLVPLREYLWAWPEDLFGHVFELGEQHFHVVDCIGLVGVSDHLFEVFGWVLAQVIHGGECATDIANRSKMTASP